MLLKILNWIWAFITGTLSEDTKSETPIYSVPKYGDKNSDVKILQEALNKTLEGNIKLLIEDGDFGPKTRAFLQEFQKSKGLYGTGIIPDDGGKTFEYLGLKLVKKDEAPVTPTLPPPQGYKPPKERMVWLRSMIGWKETEQRTKKLIVPIWKRLGLALDDIIHSWQAWCGALVATVFITFGMSYQKDGALARNWAKYGTKIEFLTNGIPEAAVVHINNNGDCSSSSGNHVAFANGDCAPEDLKIKEASIDLIGGNQSNQIKISTYCVNGDCKGKKHKVCNVRWPKEDGEPPKITKSRNCTSGKAGNESTR